MKSINNGSYYIEQKVEQESTDTDWGKLVATSVPYTPEEVVISEASNTEIVMLEPIISASVDPITTGDKLNLITSDNNIVTVDADVTNSVIDIVEVNQLTASDAQDNDYFGIGVAMSGDGLVAMVGAYGEDTAASNAGKVYTYKRATIDDVWTEVNTLTASDAEDSDGFGRSVAISNNGLVAVVGGQSEDTAASNAGKVYTYKRTTIDDVWTEVNTLTASDAQDSDYFGTSVTISDNGLVAMVGAYTQDSAALNAGKVYTYKRATIDDAWTEVNQLTASDAQDDDRFGASVAISGDGLVAIVGAYSGDSAALDGGKVYTYKRATIDDAWTEVNQLTASDAQDYDDFGASVAISGDGLVAIVGAYSGDSAALDGGKVYTYKRTTIDDAWTEVNQLTASDAQDYDDFGISVAISGDGLSVIVGAYIEDSAAADGGKVYTYKLGNYVTQDITSLNLLNPPVKVFKDSDIVLHIDLKDNLDIINNLKVLDLNIKDTSDVNGNTILSNTDTHVGNTIIADGTLSTILGKVDNGLDITSYCETSRLTNYSPEIYTRFGRSTSISDDGLVLIVGAHYEDTVVTDGGKVYTYKRATIDDTWTEVNTLTASDAQDYDYFGASVAISGDGLVAMVGAFTEDSVGSNAGKVYTYKRATIDDAWTEVNTLTASDAQDNDRFGVSVAMSNDGLIVIVGSYGVDTATVDNAGKVYTYKRATIDDAWTEVNQLVISDAQDYDYFGESLAMSNDGLVAMVSTTYGDSAGNEAGEVYTYKRATVDDAWTEVNILTASDAQVDSRFGASVAISGDGLVAMVGSRKIFNNLGGVYVYKRATIDDTWVEMYKIINHNILQGSEFGNSVTCDAEFNTFVIGSIFETNGNLSNGAVYTYKVNHEYVYDISGSQLTQKPTYVYAVNNLELDHVSSTNTEYIGEKFGISGMIQPNDEVLLDNSVITTVTNVVESIGSPNFNQEPIEVNQLTASDAVDDDQYGRSVAMSSDGLVAMVGAYTQDSAALDGGKVYTYKRATIDDTWVEINQLTASDAQDYDLFGVSVTISGDGLVAMVGAYGEDSAGTSAGKVYTYKRATVDDTWTEVSQLTASDATDTASDYFGVSVAISGDGLVTIIGAHTSDTGASGAGKVYTYKRATVDDVWTEVNQLVSSDIEISDRFGISVAMSSDGLVAIVGAHLEDTAALDSGKVYTYKRATIDDVWVEVSQLIASDAEADIAYGISVTISDNGLVAMVGAYLTDTTITDAGKVYVYERATIDDVWTEVNQLTASDAEDTDYFGVSVAMSGDGLVAIISANFEDTAALDAGKIYTYKMQTNTKVTLTIPDNTTPPTSLGVLDKSNYLQKVSTYFDGTSFVNKYEDLYKQGRALQRKYTITSKNTELLTPITTELYKVQ